MQSIDSIETYATRKWNMWNKKRLGSDKKTKCHNIIKRYTKWLTLMMLMLRKNIKEHNGQWLQIPDHLYRISITGGSVSGKTNSLFNLINQ